MKSRTRRFSFTVPAGHLTAECLLVQMKGLPTCQECNRRDTANCGGQEIRKTGKNGLGFDVPLGEDFNRGGKDDD